jgi:hypothetical protein
VDYVFVVSVLGSPSIVTKTVYMPARHVIKYGARENMTKQEKLTNGANRIVTLVYVE